MSDKTMSEQVKKANDLAKEGKFGSAVRSGGPRGDVKRDEPVDRDGNPTTQPPDLADNGSAGGADNFRRGGAPASLEVYGEEQRQLAEIARAEKADVLYHWHKVEREKEQPSQAVLSAIRSRLDFVQGPPYPPEIESAQQTAQRVASAIMGAAGVSTPAAEPASTSENGVDVVDVTSMTVSDAQANIAEADEASLDQMEKAEKKGAGRAGIQSAIDKRRAQLKQE